MRERIRQIAHQELAFRHRADDVQLRQACVTDLAVNQHLRDHSHDPTACGQCRIRERTHQTDAPPAVHEG
jgi:hypothetical protein